MGSLQPCTLVPASDADPDDSPDDSPDKVCVCHPGTGELQATREEAMGCPGDRSPWVAIRGSHSTRVDVG